MSFPDARAPLDAATLAPYLESIRRLARGLVAGDDLADDVVQETWVVALRRPPAEREHLGGWLAGIARNVARNLRRGQRRRLAREAEAAREGAAPSPAEVVERIEEHRRVLELARELDEPYRSAIVLRFFDDLTPTEIAARLGRPVATVKTHLRRGLERLRAQLDADHGGDRARWQHALGPIAFGTARPRPTPSWSPWSVAAAAAVVAVVGVIVVRTFLLEDRASGTSAPQALVADGGGPPGADGEASSPAQRLRAGGGMEGAAGAAGGLAAAEAAGRNGMERELVIPVGFEVVGGRVPATVVVRAQDLAVRRFPVGEDGNVRLRDLPEGMYVAWIESPSTLTSSDAAFAIPYRWDRLPSLFALPATPLDVRVVDAKSREPVAGAAVAVHEGGENTGAPGWTGITGADGRARILAVPAVGLPGLEALQVCATGPGHQPGRAQVVLPPTAPAESLEVTVALMEGVALRGRAVDGTGAGIVGAVVVAAPKPLRTDVGSSEGEPSLRFEDALLARVAAGPSQIAVGIVHSDRPLLEDRPDAVTVRTGAGGAFDLSCLRPGLRYEIVGLCPGHPRVTVLHDPSAPEATAPLVLQFAEFGSVVVSATDEEGKPVASPQATRSEGSWRLKDGKLVAEGLSPGWHHAWVAAPGFTAQRVQFEVESGRAVAVPVRLRPGFPLGGVVLGSDGVPVPGAIVSFEHGPEGFVEWEYGLGETYTRSAEDGTFTFPGAPAGRYRLVVNGRGYESRSGLTTDVPGEPIRIVLEPDRQSALSLTVAVPEGSTPPRTVEVYVFTDTRAEDDATAGSIMHGQATWPWTFGQKQEFGWSDGALHVAFPSGSTGLLIVAEAYAPARLSVPTGTGTAAQVVLSPGRKIRGRLIDADERPIPLGRIVVQPGWPGSPRATTAADGSFTLDHVPLGDGRVWGAADGFLPGRVACPAMHGEAPLLVRLTRGVVVQGLATGWERESCSLAVIRAVEEGKDPSASADGWELDGDSGRFRITLAPGRYVLVVSHSDREGRLPIVVEEGKPLDVTINMVPKQPRPDDR